MGVVHAFAIATDRAKKPSQHAIERSRAEDKSRYNNDCVGFLYIDKHRGVREKLGDFLYPQRKYVRSTEYKVATLLSSEGEERRWQPLWGYYSSSPSFSTTSASM